MDEFQNQFAEQRVLPSEPLPGEIVLVVFVERLVDVAQPRIGIEEHQDAVADFIIVIGCEGTHHYAHRPDVLKAYMRAADAFACSTFVEIWIGVAPDKTACVAVDWVVGH